jgi:hypothetical protein
MPRTDKTTVLNFTTRLLSGYVLGDDEFNGYLWFAQSIIENLREWMVLKTIDQSLSWTPSDTYLTAKALPTNFLRLISDNPVIVIDSVGTETVCYEISMDMRNRYKDYNNRFYIDYANNNIYFCGTASQNYTVVINYLKKPADITDSDPWPFPTWCLPVLAYEIAINYKGVDYDVVNAVQSQYNQQQLEAIKNGMFEWDSNMQVGSLRGVDRSLDDGYVFIGGTIDMNK